MRAKKNYLYDRFVVTNRNFTAEHVKIVKNFRFFSCESASKQF